MPVSTPPSGQPRDEVPTPRRHEQPVNRPPGPESAAARAAPDALSCLSPPARIGRAAGHKPASWSIRLP